MTKSGYRNAKFRILWVSLPMPFVGWGSMTLAINIVGPFMATPATRGAEALYFLASALLGDVLCGGAVFAYAYTWRRIRSRREHERHRSQ